jgi:hypothetical protein
LNPIIGFLAVGSYVKLNVLVYSGDNQISAQVLDIGLNNITKEVGIEGEGWLAFGVPRNDYYSLYLRNTHRYVWEPPNDKQILVKVYYYFYNLLFLVSGVAVVALGTALIIYYQRKSRTTRS